MVSVASLAEFAASLYDTEKIGRATLRLRDEIVALDILNEAMATLRLPMAQDGGRTDMILLNRACDVIEKHLAGKLPVDAIAREVGLADTAASVFGTDLVARSRIISATDGSMPPGTFWKKAEQSPPLQRRPDTQARNLRLRSGAASAPAQAKSALVKSDHCNPKRLRTGIPHRDVQLPQYLFRMLSNFGKCRFLIRHLENRHGW